MPEELPPSARPMLPLSDGSPAGQDPAQPGTPAVDPKQAAERKAGFIKWFNQLIGVFIALSVFYLILHYQVTKKEVRGKKVPIGYEYATLNAEQTTFIGLIYAAEDAPAPAATGEKDTPAAQVPPLAGTAAGIACGSSCKARLVIDYLKNFYNNNLDSSQAEDICKYLSRLTDEQAILHMSGVRLRVKSYFWLTGPEVYFEIMFWVLFGVVCSLLYMLSEVRRKDAAFADTDTPRIAFEPSEKPYQVAKLFYAPIVVLIIVLGYNYLKGSDVQDISTSKGMLVFAFLGGFFSGRLMAFFNRLKDALLPTGTGVPDTPATPPATTTGQPVAEQLFTLQADADIDPEIRAVLEQQGFSGAVVSATNAAGQVLTAQPKEGEQPVVTFILPNLPPGKYTINAEWSGIVKLSGSPDDQPVELVARESVEISDGAQAIPITLDHTAH